MIELTLNLTSWFLWIPSAHKEFQVVAKSHAGISAPLCSGRGHSCFSTPWCRLVPAQHSVLASGALVYDTALSGTAICPLFSGGSGGVWRPLPSLWATLDYLAPEAAHSPSRTECPQLLPPSSPVPLPPHPTPHTKPTLFPPNPSPLHPIFHPPPVVGDGPNHPLNWVRGLPSFSSPYLGPHLPFCPMEGLCTTPAFSLSLRMFESSKWILG